MACPKGVRHAMSQVTVKLQETRRALAKSGLSRAQTHAELSPMSTELILAPAAGAGIGKLLADALLAQPDFVAELVAVARRGLRAQTPRRWDKDTEDWIQDDDYRVQVQTMALLLAHMEGEPIKRVIHQHLGGNGTVDPLAALQESPALRDAARALLEKAEWRQSGRGNPTGRKKHDRQAAETVTEIE